MKIYRLTPSDFAFVWQECRRCFWLKVVEGFDRPRSPMPAIFTKIDAAIRKTFAGKRMSDLDPALPSAVLKFDEANVESTPMLPAGRIAAGFIRGRLDSVAQFNDGTYLLLDRKTSNP